MTNQLLLVISTCDSASNMVDTGQYFIHILTLSPLQIPLVQIKTVDGRVHLTPVKC